jgi:hypothetical protein
MTGAPRSSYLPCLLLLLVILLFQEHAIALTESSLDENDPATAARRLVRPGTTTTTTGGRPILVPSPPSRACAPPHHHHYTFCNTTLGWDARVDDLVARLTLDEKPYLLTARESPRGNISRLGIPECTCVRAWRRRALTVRRCDVSHSPPCLSNSPPCLSHSPPSQSRTRFRRLGRQLHARGTITLLVG